MRNRILRIEGVLCVLVMFLLIFSCKPEEEKKVINRKYEEIAEKMVKTALKDRKGYELLREFCEFGPRMNGSPNIEKALEWSRMKMEEFGFDKVWKQEVMVPNWVRGDREEAVIINTEKYKGKTLNIAALGKSVATPAEGLTGQVIEVGNLEEIKALGNEIEGKIVFLNAPFEHGHLNPSDAYGELSTMRFYGPIEVSKLNGIAFIQRSITSKYDNNPHTGVTFTVDTVEQIPAATIGLIDADLLSRALKENPYLELKMVLSCRMLPDAESYNLIGEITGSEKPDEVVLIGGHSDSWDFSEGAHDDAGGCIQALEVLDLFKRLSIRPKRTIRCVFFVNEESGIKGSLKYAAYADACQEKHIAAIESDRGVDCPRGFTFDADSLTISKAQRWLPYLRYANVEWIREGYSGVDIKRLTKCKTKIGFAPDNQRYYDYHHSANDVFSTVNPREFELGTAANAILVYLISEEGI